MKRIIINLLLCCLYVCWFSLLMAFLGLCLAIETLEETLEARTAKQQPPSF